MLSHLFTIAVIGIPAWCIGFRTAEHWYAEKQPNAGVKRGARGKVMGLVSRARRGTGDGASPVQPSH